jgi:hypothetical protein
VTSTGYGLMNIERTMPMLLRVTQKAGEDNSDLEEIYGRLVGQWSDEMGHVANIIGGATAHVRYGSQPGAVYTPVSRERQVAAIQFLDAHVFHTPAFFLDDAVTSRIEPNGSLSRINDAQARILHTLLEDGRVQRMIEISSRGGDVYTLPEMLADVRHGIWTELGDRSVAIDVYRRNLQRSYLDQLDAKINASHGDGFTIVLTPNPRSRRPADSPASMADARAAMRADLVALRADVVAALPRAADSATRAHLEDAKVAIDRTLDPNR